MKRWPLGNSYFWERAPFFRLLLPLVGGILMYDALNVDMAIVIAGIATLLAAAFALPAFIGWRKDKRQWLLFAFAHLSLFAAGAIISGAADIRNSSSWFGNHLKNGSYLARVTDAPAEKESSWKVPVSVIGAFADDGSIKNVAGNALLYFYKDNSPMLLGKGDSIIIPGNWQPIKNAGNPFEFDYAAYCRRNNIFFQQVLSGKDMRLYSTNDPAHTNMIDATHDWCMRTLDKYLPDHETKGLIQAMLLGDEVNLDEGLIRSYSDTGIVHIIAISGGNVAIFFILISALLFWLRNPRHWIKYAVALPLVWFYVLMAGAPPSAIRAAIMFSILAFGIMLQKNNNSLNLLFSTAFILLCSQPMWLFSVGFQLSFTAVLSLIVFYMPIYNRLSPKNRFAKKIWSVVTASMAAEILVAPLVIYYFHTFPLLFIVANVIAYLFMGLVLYLGMAIIALSWLPPVAFFIGACTIWLATRFDKIVIWLQGLNPASFHFLVLTGLQLVLVYVVITSLTLFLLKKNKPALFSGLSAASILVLLLCADEWIFLRQEKLVVYNTGKAMHIELIRGKSFGVGYTDTIAAKKIIYATLPAHTYWHAWREAPVLHNELFYMHGRSLLMLDHSVDDDGLFPVDYLVLNSLDDIDALTIEKVFSPKMIILGSGIPREQKNSFAIQCGPQIALYDIAEKGAFILD